MYLPKLVPAGSLVYMIGEDGLRHSLLEGGYRLANDEKQRWLWLGGIATLLMTSSRWLPWLSEMGPILLPPIQM